MRLGAASVVTAASTYYATPAQVLSIQLDQVEGAQGGFRLDARPLLKAFEDRPAFIIDDCNLSRLNSECCVLL
jgi:hypothetical protein